MSNEGRDAEPVRRRAGAWIDVVGLRVTGVRTRLRSLRASARALITRYLPNESQHLFALTLVLGVVCGVLAVAFHLAIRAVETLLIDRAIHAPGSSWMLWTIVSPTVGGLLAGAALTWIVPGARGSGIPQVKQAFAVEGGRVRIRDALGKFVIGAIQIGSGASLGREGPTVQICAGAGSLLARATSLPPRNMRRLTPVGVAAGIAAAFNAPIAAVTFTIEEIVGGLDHAVLSGVVIAAALAAVIERGILGVHPVIEVAQTYGLDHPSSLAFYALLGGAAAVVSIAFTDSLLKLRLWFRGLRVLPEWMQPAVGGLVTGGLAVVMLRFLGTVGVTGGGYEALSHALAGQLSLGVLLALCVVKLVATSFSYSSGGAGGIFAPSLMMGAALGGAVGYLDVAVLHHETRQIGAFAMVGMGAVFAGVIRAPITSVLIIFEMTGGYGLVLPLMLANMTAYLVARQWRPVPIYEALLAQDGIVLPHAAPSTHTLEQLRASGAMTTEVIAAAATDSVRDVAALVKDRQFAYIPVVNEAGGVLGVVAVAQLRAPESPDTQPITSLMVPCETIVAETPLLRAVVRMNDLHVRQMFVVDRDTGGKLVGALAMSDIVRAHAKAGLSVTPALHDDRISSIPELCAESLMVPAAVVPGSASVEDLIARLRDGDVHALVVIQSPADVGVILPEHLTEFVRDEDLRKMVIAADLVRPAVSVEASTDLRGLAAAMSDTTAEAAVVLHPGSTEPAGVVTRTAVGLAVLNWYVHRKSDRADARANTPHGLRHAGLPHGDPLR